MEWLKSFSDSAQTAIIAGIISAVVSITMFILKGCWDWFQEKYMLRYKLKKEYTFNQRMHIKESLAKSKTPLIQASEELNSRLKNFSKNIDNNWHIISEDMWTKPDAYYLVSFVYRLLAFFYWLEKAESDIYSFDFSVAAKEEKVYLKYVQSLRNFFYDCDLLNPEFGIEYFEKDYPFFKNFINKYVSYMKREDGSLITYEQFEKKIADNCETIKPVFEYISKIRKDGSDQNYNIIISFHLFLMLFLNKYGLDYHYTSREKFRELITGRYNDLQIKKGLMNFFERNKIVDEVEWIVTDLSLRDNN